jgi:dihydropteroate synthase
MRKDRQPTIFGILNVTRDSFSDGGQYLQVDAALAHAERLLADGADVIDLGAESTHPDAEDVVADEELRRLEPIIRELKRRGVPVSVDTYKAPVMRRALELGVDYINDVTALREPEATAVVRDAPARLVLMHSTAHAARAERAALAADDILARIRTFFEQRLAELADAGIAPARIILDPGMGFFLSSDARVSLRVLRGLPELRALNRPLLVSTSRKSFIGAVLGTPDAPRPAAARSAGTLATELWAAQHGADFLRTHDVRALRDALQLWFGIREADGN